MEERKKTPPLAEADGVKLAGNANELLRTLSFLYGTCASRGTLDIEITQELAICAGNLIEVYGISYKRKEDLTPEEMIALKISDHVSELAETVKRTLSSEP